MEFITTINIDRPAPEVFAYVADMSNNPAWQQGQERCEWTSPPPIRLGSTYDQEARFLGRTIRSSFEVVEFEADRRIRIRSTGGTMPIDVTRTVEPKSGGGSTVTAEIRGEPPFLMRMLGPITRAMMRSNVTKDYQRLKAILEDK